MRRALLVLTLIAIATPIAAQGFAIDFTEAEYQGEEGSSIRVFVKVTGQLAEPLQFTYVYTYGGNTAYGGSGTIAPGETDDTFTVGGIDDAFYSHGYTGKLSLYYTVPGATQPVTKTATLLLEDNDPEPAVVFDDLQVSEDDPGDVYGVTFHMTPASLVPIPLAITATGGDATPGSDFVLLDTAYSVAPRATSGQVRFRLIDDGVDEGTEFFHLGCPDRCQPATVSILDKGPQAFMAPERVEVLAGELVNFEIVIPTAENSTVAVVLASSDDSIVYIARQSYVVNINRGLTAVVVPFLTREAGQATLTATFPAWTGLAPATAEVNVYASTFSVDTETVRVKPGQEAAVTVTMDPPPHEAIALTIIPARTGIVTVPANVYVDASGTGTFTVKGKATGSTHLELRTPINRIVSFVNVEVPAPLSVSLLTPNSGPAAGGTTVTIIGEGFKGTCSVIFGTLPAASVTIVNDATLRAVTPPHAAATTDVAVQCDANKQTLSQSFTFRKSASRLRSVRH